MFFAAIFLGACDAACAAGDVSVESDSGLGVLQLVMMCQ